MQLPDRAGWVCPVAPRGLGKGVECSRVERISSVVYSGEGPFVFGSESGDPAGQPPSKTE